MRRALTCLLATLLAGSAPLVASSGSPSLAATGAEARSHRVVSRAVSFPLANTEGRGGAASCADGEEHAVRGRLLRPRGGAAATGGVIRMHVLVHDAGTGGWFWGLRGPGGVDYATALARRGETVVVLDRLGYDRSPLRDGDATCLEAQAHMLHQVVQRLRSGFYTVPGERHPEHAAHVVVHGHGTGATVAELEAATYDDTSGLVLMSSPSAPPTAFALEQGQHQKLECLGGDDYAPFGEDPAAYRRLLFASASAAVQRAATRQRNATPCGDVRSLAPAVATAAATAGSIEVPVLLLSGGRDSRVRPLDDAAAAALYDSTEELTTRTFARAGSALPLESAGAEVRSAVLRWVARL